LGELFWEDAMPRGDKSKYKQRRKADHIIESYESRGLPEDEAERRAWATVNKESGGGKKSGSGRGKSPQIVRRASAALRSQSNDAARSSCAAGDGAKAWHL
jgi:hypothetical protein